MKKIVLISTVLLAFTACQVEGALTQDKVIKPIEATSVIKYSVILK